jgi:hypothetical protein
MPRHPQRKARSVIAYFQAEEVIYLLGEVEDADPATMIDAARALAVRAGIDHGWGSFGVTTDVERLPDPAERSLVIVSYWRGLRAYQEERARGDSTRASAIVDARRGRR